MYVGSGIGIDLEEDIVFAASPAGHAVENSTDRIKFQAVNIAEVNRSICSMATAKRTDSREMTIAQSKSAQFACIRTVQHGVTKIKGNSLDVVHAKFSNVFEITTV